MEDESGLELSLGLSFGGSSSKPKVKDAPSDSKGDEGRSNRLMESNVTIFDDSFKNHFKSSLENKDPHGKQKIDLITQPQENFFTDLAKCSTSMTDCSNDAQNNLVWLTKYREQLISGNRAIETEEEKSGSSKRKLTFDNINFQKKPGKLVDYSENKGANKSSGAPLLRNSHISNTTEDGSTGENEDVAESEAEGPQPRLVSNRDQNAKCREPLKFSGKSILSESSGIGFQGLREPNLSGKESNPNYEKPTSEILLSLQPPKFANVFYPVAATVPSTSGRSNAASFPSTSVMPLIPITNGERPVAPAANTNGIQLAFGYPSAQLPRLESSSSSAFNSQPLHVSCFTGREQSTGVQIQQQFEDASQDLVISSTRNVGDAGISGRPEDQSKPRSNSMQANESTNKPTTEGSSRDAPPSIRPGIAPNPRFDAPPAIRPGIAPNLRFDAPPAIRPGIAPNLRFGGCGSYPDLPWVTTTGQGPNGKTISGVTYKLNQNQIQIVCACHGTHMSPEEFIRHASSEAPIPENNLN